MKERKKSEDVLKFVDTHASPISVHLIQIELYLFILSPILCVLEQNKHASADEGTDTRK